MAAESDETARTAPKGKQEWVKEIDYLRAFAVLAVLMIHTCSYFFVLPGLNLISGVNLFLAMYSTFAVPLFVLISGFVIHRQYSGKIDVLKFYKKRLIILPPYVLFSVLYVILIHLIPDPVVGYVITTPITLKYLVFVLVNAQGYLHLWFFSILIQFYLFYPVFRKIYSLFEAKGREDLLLVFSFAAQVLWNVLTIPTQQKIPGTQTHLFLEGFFYFILGMFAARNFDRVKEDCSRHSVFSIASFSVIIMLGAYIPVAAGLLYNGYLWKVPYLYNTPAYILAPISFALVFAFLYKLALRLSEKRGRTPAFLKSVGSLSFGIYLMHMIFNMLIVDGLAIAGIGAGDWFFYPIVFFGSLALTYPATYGLSLLPFSDWIIGSSSFRKMKPLKN